jgi:hypothetical protein
MSLAELKVTVPWAGTLMSNVTMLLCTSAAFFLAKTTAVCRASGAASKLSKGIHLKLQLAWPILARVTPGSA